MVLAIEVLTIAVMVATILTPIVIAIGFYYAYKQWSSTRNSRMAQLIVNLGERWDSPEMAKSRQAVNLSGRNLKADFDKADKDDDIKAYTDYVMVANFFDELGLLVSKDFMECSIAWQIWGKAEKTYYNLYEGIIKIPENEEYFQNFIKLNGMFKNEEACRPKIKTKHAP